FAQPLYAATVADGLARGWGCLFRRNGPPRWPLIDGPGAPIARVAHNPGAESTPPNPPLVRGGERSSADPLNSPPLTKGGWGGVQEGRRVRNSSVRRSNLATLLALGLSILAARGPSLAPGSWLTLHHADAMARLLQPVLGSEDGIIAESPCDAPLKFEFLRL